MKHLNIILIILLILTLTSLIISIIALIRPRKDRYQSSIHPSPSPSPSGTWVPLKPLKQARYAFGVAVMPYDSSPSSYNIYAVGGFNGTPDSSYGITMYNTATKQWTPRLRLGLLPVSRNMKARCGTEFYVHYGWVV